ncbi:hypothetical protein QH639_20275 [Lysinibacillus sp. 1 U-2021]|uniref:hypothetical protein n=1 Tax=Lysinibacillus sp. 1 U-2021 TaxID=3039426 RepID=UPI00248156A3|nr:hypothetical protein [Lysinibacillus sp. 1 U-2021]WGT38135.1 hypothetical protein QH639_20275 [Lysinibacillus sp. 1 U-2021]
MGINHLLKQISEGVKKEIPIFDNIAIDDTEYYNFPRNGWTTVKTINGKGKIKSFSSHCTASNSSCATFRILVDGVPVGFMSPVSPTQNGITNGLRVSESLLDNAIYGSYTSSVGQRTYILMFPGTPVEVNFYAGTKSTPKGIGEYTFESIGDVSTKYLLVSGFLEFSEKIEFQLCRIGPGSGGDAVFTYEGVMYVD